MATTSHAQNIYDNDQFFNKYNKLPRATYGHAGAEEWPDMCRMVGNVKDARVLDLGCGAGWFCRWAAESSALFVRGIDISQNMIKRARTFEQYKDVISYECGNMETLTLPPNSFDVVYGSLALHHLPDLSGLFSQISRCLRAGGRFVFSVEHPIVTASSDANWKRDTDGRIYWPLNRYFDEGLRVTEWMETKDVRKYHHTVETYLGLLIQNGFILRSFRESWDSMDRDKAKDDTVGSYGHRPYFLLIGAQVARDDVD